MTLYDILFSFFTYSFLGWCVEVAFAAVKQRQFVNRGFLNGPVCPIYGVGVTLIVALLEPYTMNIGILYVLSAILVTLLEYVTGALLEKLFQHKWWDYTGMPLNIKGYVCLPFSLIWGAACVVIVKFIYPAIYKVISFLPMWLGSVILVLLCGLLIADICVTVSGILNWNRHLEKMEELVAELHRMSEQIGENIYQNVMGGMEKEAEVKQKLEKVKQRYAELLDSQDKTQRRLLKAFPTLKSKRHQERLEEIKNWIQKKKHNPKM